MLLTTIPNNNQQPVVDVQDLSRNFGTVQALSHLSLSVLSGELFGLVGPDSAGKTTLIRILSGLMAPSSGSVCIFGEDPLTQAHLRDAMGVMPQHYSLYGDLSIEENLHFFGKLYNLPKATYDIRKERLLALTRLGSFLKRRADALSGGMYKKLALACALLHEPSILLLDEPTNGVDPVSRRELWELLHDFAHQGMTIIISTAYMDEAARCHHVCLLDHGHILAQGEPGVLVEQLRFPVFELQGGDRIKLGKIAQQLPGILATSPAGERLRIITEAQATTALTQAFAHYGAQLKPVPADFEDVFLTAHYTSSRAKQ